MNILEKIREYRLERNWTEYQLAEFSEIPQSTISSWYRKNQIPTILSLEKICKAFDITLAQFFTDEQEKSLPLTQSQLLLLHEWNRLNERQKEAFLNFLKVL